MSVYADDTPDEQRVLARAIRAAAVLVSTASPGPQADTVSEGFASAEYVLGSLEAHIGNTLVSSTIMAIKDRLDKDEEPFADYVELATASDAAEQARAALTAVATLLDSRTTPQEAAGYKDWLIGVAQASAQGAIEDKGFLGRGGVQVNHAEREAIAEVGRLLGR